MDLPYFASVGSIIWWQPGQYVLSRALVNFSSQFGHTTVRRFILASVSHPSEVAGGARGWAASAPATRVAARETVRYTKVLMDFPKPIGQTYGSIKLSEPPVSPSFRAASGRMQSPASASPRLAIPSPRRPASGRARCHIALGAPGQIIKTEPDVVSRREPPGPLRCLARRCPAPHSHGFRCDPAQATSSPARSGLCSHK